MTYEEKYKMLRKAALEAMGAQDDMANLIALLGEIHRSHPTNKVLPLVVALIETNKPDVPVPNT